MPQLGGYGGCEYRRETNDCVQKFDGSWANNWWKNFSSPDIQQYSRSSAWYIGINRYRAESGWWSLSTPNQLNDGASCINPFYNVPYCSSKLGLGVVSIPTIWNEVAGAFLILKNP
jgi:hypothetical protein